MVAQLLSMDTRFIGDHQGVIDLFTVTGATVSGAYYPRSRIAIGAAIDSCTSTPATPAYIIGPNCDPCPTSSVTYQVPAVANADSYQWQVDGTRTATTNAPFLHVSCDSPQCWGTHLAGKSGELCRREWLAFHDRCGIVLFQSPMLGLQRSLLRIGGSRIRTVPYLTSRAFGTPLDINGG